VKNTKQHRKQNDNFLRLFLSKSKHNDVKQALELMYKGLALAAEMEMIWLQAFQLVIALFLRTSIST